MSYAIEWDLLNRRIYECGIDRVVLYPMKDIITDVNDPYQNGVVWNGVTSINNSSSGGEPNPLFADNIKYLNLMSVEDLSLSIEAYTYPDEFKKCDGSVGIIPGLNIGQQHRKSFGISYRTLVGNAEKQSDFDYKLHIVYNCLATPSDNNYSTVNDSPEAVSFSWNVNTITVSANGYKPFSQIIIDSRKISKKKLDAIENILYGDSNNEPAIPDVNVILDILGFDDLIINAADSDSIIEGILVSTIQNGISIENNSVSGEVLSSDWLFDPFSFETGEITESHYYLALDFSDNNYDLITNCIIGLDLDNLDIDIINAENHIILIEITNSSDLYIVQEDPYATHVQHVDISNLVRS